MRLIVIIASVFISSVCCELFAQESALEFQNVDDKRLPTGQLIQPVGDVVSFHGRPVDIKIGVESKLLFVKDRNALRVIDPKIMKIVQSIESPDGASLYGLAVGKSGDVYFTNSKNGLHIFSNEGESDDEEPDFVLKRTIALSTDSFPCGFKISDDEKSAYVCLSKKNAVAIVDIESGKTINTISVGVAPFHLTKSGNHLFVSNIGGRMPENGDQTAPSAGTETVVDKRGIARTGTVSLIDLGLAKVVKTFNVGRHPSVLEFDHAANSVLVCNTNDDSVSRINMESGLASQFTAKPAENIPFGSMPSAILKDVKRQVHFVALAGNNAVAVVNTADRGNKIESLIPTAWYPVAMAADDTHLFVACVKGVGARADRRDESGGRNSHDHLGTVQKIALASLENKKLLSKWTKLAKRNARISRSTAVVEKNEANKNVAAVPIPSKLGEPSVFKHVIYVIKENRTFDQVFGDIPEARSEPKLCIFPEKITPNHHALARRFGILDNYYCNGVLSADGHSWATEGNVTPYLERAFGGFARSYTFGDDPITYSSSGFLWDHVLDAGLSFRNYGEFNYSTPPEGMEYQEIWQAYENGESTKFKQNIGVERVRRYSCLEYPGWNMFIPDVLRIDRFLKEFREFEQGNSLPSLCLVYLPQDHLGGGVTTRSHMADNDLALGKLVEAVSNSRFWKDTVIFINEDDPQNGYDHIDGHRSLCLVVSPYSKRGVNHQFYNQTSVLRTILHIFGLPPMNQQDAAAPLMSGCFQATPDLSPYKKIAANFPLNEMPPSEKDQSAVEKMWRSILATVPIQRTGLKTEKDEDNLNRFVWHEMKGWTTPYPVEWSGAHARGLKELGLKVAEVDGD